MKSKNEGRHVNISEELARLSEKRERFEEKKSDFQKRKEEFEALAQEKLSYYKNLELECQEIKENEPELRFLGEEIDYKLKEKKKEIKVIESYIGKSSELNKNFFET